MRSRCVLLAMAANDDELPREFRLFRRGVNETSKGAFLFDDQAAQSVMASFAKGGVRLMLDLEHNSLSGSDTDARAWYDLEVRSGELWAVNVNWTPDGARRLREKTQAYVSPAFDTDQDNRVVQVYNAALTSMPATYAPQALIAASNRSFMTPEMIQKALEALKTGDADAALALLEEALVSAAGSDAPPEAAPEDAPVEAMAGAPADSMSEDEKKKEGVEAVAASILSAIGATSVEEIKAWKAAAEQAEATRKGIELSAQRVLVAELVKLGVETPATAWEGDPKAQKPCARLSAESVEDLRSRVALLKAAGKGKEIKPPSGKETQVTLSQAELDACKARNLDPKVYAARKATAIRRSV